MIKEKEKRSQEERHKAKRNERHQKRQQQEISQADLFAKVMFNFFKIQKNYLKLKNIQIYNFILFFLNNKFNKKLFLQNINEDLSVKNNLSNKMIERSYKEDEISMWSCRY